jgi:hypothetical protein
MSFVLWEGNWKRKLKKVKINCNDINNIIAFIFMMKFFNQLFVWNLRDLSFSMLSYSNWTSDISTHDKSFWVKFYYVFLIRFTWFWQWKKLQTVRFEWFEKVDYVGVLIPLWYHSIFNHFARKQIFIVLLVVYL